MHIEIKTEALTQSADIQNLTSIAISRSEDSQCIAINLEDAGNINLATFNALIVLYVKLRRMGKDVRFLNCQAPRLKDLVSKTHFSHVFNSK